MKYAFDSALGSFLAEIDGLAASLPIIMRAIGESHKNAAKDVGQFLQKYGTLESTREESTEDDGIQHIETYNLNVDYFYELEALRDIGIAFTAASAIIPRSFIVSMVSQYDAFLGRLIRSIYFTKPELLNASDRNLSFSNLLQFNTMEEAREFILEKEVEGILRESHSDQFDWLEKKLGMELRKGLEIWPSGLPQ